MAKLKHKKIVRHDLTTPAVVDSKPLRIYINSDGNIIELQSYQQNIRTFIYIQSNTKLGQTVTMNDEVYNKFIQMNDMMPKQKFVRYVQKINILR